MHETRSRNATRKLNANQKIGLTVKQVTYPVARVMTVLHLNWPMTEDKQHT